MDNGSMGYQDLGNMTFNTNQSGNQDPKFNLNIDPDNFDKSKLKIIGFVAAGVVALIVVVFVLLKVFGTAKYEAVAKDYIQTTYDVSLCGKEFDEKKFSKQYPKFMEEVLDEYYDRMDDSVDYAKDRLEDMTDYLDLEDDLKWSDFCKFTYKLGKPKKINSRKLKDYEDEISEYDSDIKVQAGYKIKVEPDYEFKFSKKMEEAINDSLDDLDYDDLDDVDDLCKYLKKQYKPQDLEIIVLKCNGKIGVWLVEDSYIWRSLESWEEEMR